MASHATLHTSPGLVRWLDPRYLLLGALLPDATRFTIILVDVLDWPAVATFTYFIPFHSLLITALLAGAIALVLPVVGVSSRWAFGLIMAGATLHMLLDDVEGSVGCGSTTFYPFYFGKPLSGWNSEGHFATLLLIAAAMAIGVAFGQKHRWPLLRLKLTRWRVLAALGLLAVALVLPLFFRQWMIERNAYYLGFFTDPAAFTGQQVELCFSEVVGTDPLTIEEFDTQFVLQAPATFETGEWVSVRGIYREGTIRPTTLIRHQGFSDITLSLVAAAVFVFLLFDRRYLKFLTRGHNRLRRQKN